MDVNGQRVSTHELGIFTTFQQRIYYDTYDVSQALWTFNSTKQVIGELISRCRALCHLVTGIMLGHGWYAQPSVNVGPPSLFFTLNVHAVFPNGTSGVVTVVSDTTWTQSVGPITADDIYNGMGVSQHLFNLIYISGETFDSRLVQPGWTLPSFDASQWVAASVVPPPSANVILSSHAIMPHIAIEQSYTPIQMWESAPGTWVFDFGQNMVRLFVVLPAFRDALQAGFTTLYVPEGLATEAGIEITQISAETYVFMRAPWYLTAPQTLWPSPLGHQPLLHQHGRAGNVHHRWLRCCHQLHAILHV